MLTGFADRLNVSSRGKRIHVIPRCVSNRVGDAALCSGGELEGPVSHQVGDVRMSV